MTYQKLYKELKKKIEKDFGKKCKDFYLGCCRCNAYLMLQLLKDIVELEEFDSEDRIIRNL